MIEHCDHINCVYKDCEKYQVIKTRASKPQLKCYYYNNRGDAEMSKNIEQIILETSLPPDIQEYFEFRGVKGGNKKRFVSSKGKRYERDMFAIVMRKNAMVLLKTTLNVTLTISFNNHKREILNDYVTPILNGLLKAGVYENIAQIEKLTVIKGETARDSKVSILIEVV